MKTTTKVNVERKVLWKVNVERQDDYTDSDTGLWILTETDSMSQAVAKAKAHAIRERWCKYKIVSASKFGVITP